MILIPGTPEYEKHLANCTACRCSTYRHVTQAQFRPHTMGSDCWCIGNNLPKVCELNTRIWQDLPEVEYV